MVVIDGYIWLYDGKEYVNTYLLANHLGKDRIEEEEG